MSIGRGTLTPFQKIGYPDLKYGNYQFTPKSIVGMSVYPKHQNKLCYGRDLSKVDPPKEVDLTLLLEFYQMSEMKDEFFIGSFDRLAGSSTLRQQILDGLSWSEIQESWEDGIEQFKILRKKYLLYPDFN